MKKIILLLLLTANIYSAPTFNIDLDASDNCICDGYWEFDNSRLSGSEDWYSGDNTLNLGSSCIDNEQKIIPRIDNLELASEQYDKWKFDKIFDTYLCKVCEESTPPPPPEEEDPLLWTKIYEGNPALAPSECYEPDEINFKSYTYKTVACGDETMRCYKQNLPKYDCKALGTDWTHSEDETDAECQELIPDMASQTSFMTGSNISPTCCFVPTPDNDNNDTGNDSGGGTDTDNTPSNSTCTTSIKPLVSDYDNYVWIKTGVGISTVQNCYDITNGVSNKKSATYGEEGSSDFICCVGTLRTTNTGGTDNDGGTDSGGNSDNGGTDNSGGSDGGSSGGGSGGGTTKTNDILSGIKSDINESNNALDSISKELNASNGTLNKIEENTRFLKDLKSTFEDSEKSLSDIKDEFSNLSNILNNSQSSVSSALSGMLGSLNGFSSPVFQGQGQSVFTTSVFGQNIEFDFSMVEQLKQYFDIVFMLLLVYFNFKMYRWIIEVLLKMGV